MHGRCADGCRASSGRSAPAKSLRRARTLRALVCEICWLSSPAPPWQGAAFAGIVSPIPGFLGSQGKAPWQPQALAPAFLGAGRWMRAAEHCGAVWHGVPTVPPIPPSPGRMQPRGLLLLLLLALLLLAVTTEAGKAKKGEGEPGGMWGGPGHAPTTPTCSLSCRQGEEGWLRVPGLALGALRPQQQGLRLGLPRGDLWGREQEAQVQDPLQLEEEIRRCGGGRRVAGGCAGCCTSLTRLASRS